MISDKKFIQDVYLVQNFSKYFNIYTKVLIVLVGLMILFIGGRWQGLYLIIRAISPYTKIISIVVSLTAIIASPFILWILSKEKRNGWIIGFIVSVVIPLLFVFLLFGVNTFRNQSVFLPILFYSVFCYMLNSEVKDWLNEYYSHQNRLEQKRLKEERIKNGLWD